MIVQKLFVVQHVAQSLVVPNFACFDLTSNSAPQNVLKSLVVIYLSWWDTYFSISTISVS